MIMTDIYVAKTWSVQVVTVASRCSTPAVLELRDSASHQAGGLTGCPMFDVFTEFSKLKEHIWLVRFVSSAYIVAWKFLVAA